MNLRSSIMRSLAAPLLLLTVWGSWVAPSSAQEVPEAPPATTLQNPLPVLGADTTLDVGTWNIEWFGHSERGPGDEALQLANARAVLSGLGVDLWSVQEIVDEGHFRVLVDGLDGYAGLLANDPVVVNGRTFYSDWDNREQKVGLIYRESLLEFLRARVILTERNHEFAGRPPLEAHFVVRPQGASLNRSGPGSGGSPGGAAGQEPWELVVIALHAKAGADADDWTRRRDGALALKRYLDRTYPDRPVLIIGDFNDDTDRSIHEPSPSPYQNFIDDGARWTFATAELSDRGQSTMVTYPDAIDHHLVSDEVGALLIPGTVTTVDGRDHFPGYGDTTSDHLPVVARYRMRWR